MKAILQMKKDCFHKETSRDLSLCAQVSAAANIPSESGTDRNV